MIVPAKGGVLFGRLWLEFRPPRNHPSYEVIADSADPTQLCRGEVDGICNQTPLDLLEFVLIPKWGFSSASAIATRCPFRRAST